MTETPLLSFAAFAGLSLVSLLLWWAIYELVLTRGHSAREAIFGRRPNVAVALDMAGGFLALGILNFQIISSPPLESFHVDLEVTGLTLAGTIVLLGLLRLLIGGGLRLWFGKRRDRQGQIVSFNNELFVQRNLATGVFSTALYLILVAGLIEQDLLNIMGLRPEALLNMVGVWLLGGAVVVLHSWFYLGFFTKEHVLYQCFHENNPAAATSLLGLVAGVLMLNHALLLRSEPGAHLFSQPNHWGYLLAAIAFVLVLRSLLQLLLLALAGVSLRHELHFRANPAWGVLDGGLIFSFFLILTALLT